MPPAVAAAPPARPGLATSAAAVVVAAAAMVATLPGRTHGLGLVTEPLLADLGLGRVPFAALNFWATLIGSVFCLPVGWLTDRLGVRAVLAVVLAGLGAVVVAMTRVTAGGASVGLPTPEVFFVGGVETAVVPLELFLLVLLTRGLGQSALSVVSLALVGKAAGNRPGPAVGVYSFLVAVGFMGAFAAVKAAFEQLHADWRAVWAGIGWALLALGVPALAFVREPRTEAAGLSPLSPWGRGEKAAGPSAPRCGRPPSGCSPWPPRFTAWSRPACRCSTSRCWPSAASTARCS